MITKGAMAKPIDGHSMLESAMAMSTVATLVATCLYTRVTPEKNTTVKRKLIANITYTLINANTLHTSHMHLCIHSQVIQMLTTSN